MKEAVLAIKLERRYSKKQILGFYLNTIYLGRGAYGIEAAARAYFDRHASELSLSQTAYLAGIIPSPESYQPDANPQGAVARRDRVLADMQEQGYVDASQVARASRGRVKLKGHVDERQQPAAYFMEWLRKVYLYPEYENCLYTCGLKIYTTLDLDLQDAAEEAVDSILTEKKDPEAALVSTTPKGEVRAFVGGRNFTNVRTARGFSFASDPPGRQAGSSFKPFTLLTAIEEGISPASRFSGASPAYIPEPCAGSNGLPPWEVENYGGSSYGTLTLDQATTNSVNTVYAQLVHEVGPEKLVDVLDELQFDRSGTSLERKIDPNCGLSLGILDVTPVEMARAYAAFAGRGVLPEIQPIRYITNSQDECLKSYRPERGVDCEEEDELEMKRIVDANTADVVNQTLTHVVQGGTATVANIGRPVAGKTGTTQLNVDAWFAGYVPQLVTVVWEGYPAEKNGELVPRMGYCSDLELCRPVHGYEVTGGGAPVSPAVIWRDFMLEATADLPAASFEIPTDLPDTIINSPPPAPTGTPKPDKTKGDPKPKPTDPEPTPEPEPTPVPSPTQEPTPLISPTTGEQRGGRREEEGDP
jgi:membrane peptidoglycan carboxypeptidase